MEVKTNDENKRAVDLFIRKFIGTLKSPLSVKQYTKYENLVYISEILGSKYEDEQLVSKANTYVGELVNDLNNGNYNMAGMFSEVGMLAFAVDTIYKKTGDLVNLTASLNNVLLQYGNYTVSNSKYKKLNTGMYDCISGVSGVLYYLLDTNIYLNNKDSMTDMIEYLINLTDTHLYKGKPVTNFHIENENLMREDEKNMFKDGTINFGLAHGMIGVLASLTKVYELQVYKDKDKILKSIHSILDMYEKYVCYTDNISMYPTQLDYNEYISEDIIGLKNVCSWCYGNISNELILSKTYKVLGDDVNYNKHMNNLASIINQDDKRYNLSVPVLCHGYASVIAEQVSTYRYTQDDNFIKNIDRNISKMFDLCDDVNRRIPDLKVEDLNPKIGLNVVQGHKDDLSMLCGSGGIFLSLLSVAVDNTRFQRLLMID